MYDQPQDHRRAYVVHAPSARLFRLGEWLEAGAPLGLASPGGDTIYVEHGGHVVDIQYDIWHERLALLLAAPAGLARTA